MQKDTVSINIKVSDKEFSLRIDPKEEVLLRQAAQKLNEQLREKKQRMGVINKQDLLTMVAFDCMVASLKSESKYAQLGARLQALEDLLTRELKTDSLTDDPS